MGNTLHKPSPYFTIRRLNVHLETSIELFCPRETRRSLVAIKFKIFSEEAASVLAGFQAGPIAFGDVGFCGGRKTGEHGEKPSEHGENQQQTHCTGTEPRSHCWEASVLTSASSLLPKTFPNIIRIPRSPWKASVLITEYTARFVQFDESCPIHCLCITYILPSI